MKNIMNYFICAALITTQTSTYLHAECKNKKVTVDYIVIGAGTAGAVMAKRLSDDKKSSVLAIHRDGNLTQDPDIKYTTNALTTVVGAMFGSPFYQTGNTTPQPFANNRELFWAMGLPLGGGSSVNAGAFVRGTNELYAQWEAIAGPLWSVNRILDIFKELETYDGETTNPSARGFHGPINVRQNPDPSKIAIKFSQAQETAFGLPQVLDYNDPNTPIGISPQLQYTQKGPYGILRVSSSTAFLNNQVMTPAGRGVNGRKLRVLFNSIALRTIWEGNKAVGVEYLDKCGKVKQVYARKGVIVSAGLYSSAFLLHSGVGPASLLNPLGIPVVYDNPNVGNGLADQPHIVIVYESNPADFPRGPMTGVFTQIAFLPTPGDDPTVRTVRLSTQSPVPGTTSMLVDLSQPLSRGRITINSADPLKPPVIDVGELSNSADLTLYQQSFQVYIRAMNHALANIDPLYKMVFPDPAVLDDINLLTDFIREEIDCNQHFQSHCRMAPLDQGGVVDSTGHVYGVENLIVADNSISPLVMDGAPMASAYLIASNIALILLGN